MNPAILRFYKKYKDMPEIDHVIDFLKDQYANKNSINFNYEQALEKAKAWTQKLNKNKQTDPGQVEILKQYDDFVICRLIDSQSKIYEGYMMSHCVGSASYQSKDFICSLRDKNNKPHATFEFIVENKSIITRQIKGKANGPVSLKYKSYVLDFLSSIGARVERYEMMNIGFLYVSREESKLLKTIFPKIEIVDFQNDSFIHTNKSHDYDTEAILKLSNFEKKFLVDTLVQTSLNFNLIDNLLKDESIRNDLNFINDLFASTIIHNRYQAGSILASCLNPYYQSNSFFIHSCFLSFAIGFNRLNFVSLLLKHNFPINDTAVEFAVQAQNIKIINLILFKIKINDRILKLLASRSQIETFRFFIENNALSKEEIETLMVNLVKFGRADHIKSLINSNKNQSIDFVSLFSICAMIPGSLPLLILIKEELVKAQISLPKLKDFDLNDKSNATIKNTLRFVLK